MWHVRTFTENMSCHFHSRFLRRSKSNLTYSTLCSELRSVFLGSKKYPLSSGVQPPCTSTAPRPEWHERPKPAASRWSARPKGRCAGPHGPGHATLISTRYIFLAHYIAGQKGLHLFAFYTLRAIIIVCIFSFRDILCFHIDSIREEQVHI